MSSLPHLAPDAKPTALSLYTAGSQYKLAAHLLMSRCNTQELIGCLLPVEYMLNIALELLLKSVILHKTGEQDQLLDLKHDLKKALRKAKESGFEAPSDVEIMVRESAAGHRKHVFRYLPDVEKIEVWHPLNGIIALDMLILAAQDFIGLPHLREHVPHEAR